MFDSEKLYPPNDSALRTLGTTSTLAHWRSAGAGPPYLRIGHGRRGGRVLYRGRDLNEWLNSRRVKPGEPMPDSNNDR